MSTNVDHRCAGSRRNHSPVVRSVPPIEMAQAEGANRGRTKDGIRFTAEFPVNCWNRLFSIYTRKAGRVALPPFGQFLTRIRISAFRDLFDLMKIQ
jgi:hypothetical protein